MYLFYLYRGINNFLVLFIIKKVVISSFDTIHIISRQGKLRHVLGMKLTETTTYCVFNRSLLTKSHWYKDCLSDFGNYIKSFLLSTWTYHESNIWPPSMNQATWMARKQNLNKKILNFSYSNQSSFKLKML